MLFGRKKKAALPPPPEWAHTAVVWNMGSFFTMEQPVAPENRRMYLCPYIEDSDPTFPRFMRQCGTQLLAQYPFAVEYLEFHDPEEVDTRYLLPLHRARSGVFLEADQRHIITISSEKDRKILEIIPEFDLHCICSYRGYGYRHAPSHAALADLERSPFDLRISCFENHDHMQIEAPVDPTLDCLPVVDTLCQQEGRRLCHGRER